MNNDVIIKANADVDTIKHRIYEVRGLRVMLDRDMAELYEVEVKYLKRQVNRNIERFPSDFMFEVTQEEYDSLRCQNGTLKSGRGQHAKYMPYVFTEEGVAMLSGILRSPMAIQVNINIMRAFVAIRHDVSAWQDTNLKVEQLSHKVDQLNNYVEEILHDQNDINQQQDETNAEIALQIEAINDALDQLCERPSTPRKRIGFKQSKNDRAGRREESSSGAFDSGEQKQNRKLLK